MITLAQWAWKRLVARPEVSICVLGIDGAGKSSFLNLIRQELGVPTTEVVPTLGQIVTKGHTRKAHYLFWDVSGKESLRQNWSLYYPHLNYIFYVIDVSDFSRLQESILELNRVMHHPLLQYTPVLVVLHKIDARVASGVDWNAEQFIADTHLETILGPRVSLSLSLSSGTEAVERRPWSFVETSVSGRLSEVPVAASDGERSAEVSEMASTVTYGSPPRAALQWVESTLRILRRRSQSSNAEVRGTAVSVHSKAPETAVSDRKSLKSSMRSKSQDLDSASDGWTFGPLPPYPGDPSGNSASLSIPPGNAPATTTTPAETTITATTTVAAETSTSAAEIPTASTTSATAVAVEAFEPVDSAAGSTAPTSDAEESALIRHRAEEEDASSDVAVENVNVSLEEITEAAG